LDRKQIFGTVIRWPFSGDVSVAPAATVVSDEDVSGVKGTELVTVPMVAALWTCAAASTTMEESVGGVKDAAKVTAPEIAALPACAAAAT